MQSNWQSHLQITSNISWQFVENFGLLMGLGDDASKRLFLKIDYDNDGGITWEEFSNYIMALGRPSEKDMPNVLEVLVNPHVPAEYTHYQSICAVAVLKTNQWRMGMDRYEMF